MKKPSVNVRFIVPFLFVNCLAVAVAIAFTQFQNAQYWAEKYKAVTKVVKTDTVVVKTDTVVPVRSLVPVRRYFFLAYSTQEKNSSDILTGETWFTSDSGFPKKTDIDRDIFSSFPKKRKCYQHLLITCMFEFKNSEDYNNFTAAYKGDKNPAKQAECCKPSKLIIYSPNYWDTLQLSPTVFPQSNIWY